MQWWLWLAFFASFAVKLPMWPVHTWLPDAHVEAPTAGSVILAGILLKMGGYGFLRFSLPMFPLASQEFAPLVFALVDHRHHLHLAGGAGAGGREEADRLFQSVAHMGFVTMGIFSFTVQGVDGAIFQMLSPRPRVGRAVPVRRRRLRPHAHARDRAPTAASSTACRCTPSCSWCSRWPTSGCPAPSGFIGEFLTLVGAFKANTWVAFLATIGVILSAAYALYLYRRMIFGPLEKPSLQGHLRHELSRGAGVRPAGAAGDPVRLLSGAAARRDGGVGEEARLQLRDGHQAASAMSVR